jgi:hypothetical protein
MDLKKFDTIGVAEKGWDCVIIDPETKEDTDMVVHLYGAGSKAYKQAMSGLDAYKTLCVSRGKAIDVEKVKEYLIDVNVKCTRGWEGFEEEDKELPFSPETARRIYTDYPLIWEQVHDSIHDVVSQLSGK